MLHKTHGTLQIHRCYRGLLVLYKAPDTIQNLQREQRFFKKTSAIHGLQRYLYFLKRNPQGSEPGGAVNAQAGRERGRLSL